MIGELSDGLAGAITLAVLILSFAMFVRERHPPEVIAGGAITTLIVAGVLTPQEAFSAMASPAPVTIACMFVLSAALVRAGLIEAVSERLSRHARRRPTGTMAGFAAFVTGMSAIANNTPIVAVLLPVAIRLAQAIGVGASRLLIPLSYCAILGGMITMMGTSTNLLVDGVAQRHGLEPFTLLEITPLGLTLAGAGLVYLALAGPRLLPDRQAPADLASQPSSLRYMTEVAIPEASPVIGRRLDEVDLFQREGITIADVLRNDESLRRSLRQVVLEEGDRVVLRTGVSQLVDLRHGRGLKAVDRVSLKNAIVVEALVPPGCALIGRSLGRARLRRRYGVYPLAAHRRGPMESSRLEDIVIRVGDTMMLEGSQEDLGRLADDVGLIVLTRRVQKPFRPERAPLVLALFGGVVALSALGAAPLVTLVMAAVAVALFTRCIDAEEAFAAVDGRLLALILAMLGVGAALEKTGVIGHGVAALTPWMTILPPLAILFAVILTTSVLTEMVTNNAVAVVMTPVAIAVAGAVGADPRPFVVGVMVAASMSFATPIGYQTNTLVYAPGGYRFSDYLRVGAPLNLFLGATATAAIPFIWPL